MLSAEVILAIAAVGATLIGARLIPRWGHLGMASAVLNQSWQDAHCGTFFAWIVRSLVGPFLYVCESHEPR